MIFGGLGLLKQHERLLFDSTWHEDEHPRDKQGRFSVKSSASTTIEHQMDAGAGSGAMGRFAELTGESTGGQQAYEDALHLTGLPIDVPVIERDDLPFFVPMRYNLNTKTIEVGTMPMTRADAASFMAEELFHALDHIDGLNTLSADSSKFDLNHGNIAVPVINHYQKGGYFGEFLRYPLHPTYQLSTDRIKAELFARLGVLYMSDPEVLKRELPQTYEVYHECFGLSKYSPVGTEYVRSKIWSTSGGSGASSSQYGQQSLTRPTYAGSVRTESRSGLESLRRRLSQSLEARPEGRRIIL